MTTQDAPEPQVSECPVVTTVSVSVDLNDPAVAEALEPLIRTAWVAGYRTRRDAAAYSDISATYTDWRGWGPGFRLPGGAHFRQKVEFLERVLGVSSTERARPRWSWRRNLEGGQ